MIRAKRRTFPSQVVYLADELTFLEFVATEDMRLSGITFCHPPD